MKLSKVQLQHIEDFELSVASLAKSIEALRIAARQLDAVGVVADFAMPDPIKVVHYVFKSVPITVSDIKAAKAERDGAIAPGPKLPDAATAIDTRSGEQRVNVKRTCPYCEKIPEYTHRDGEPVCRCSTASCPGRERWLTYEEFEEQADAIKPAAVPGHADWCNEFNRSGLPCNCVIKHADS